MKKVDLRLPLSLGRALAELAIIVMGVLIALGAQSWWEARDRAQAGAAAMRAIDDDLALIEVRMVEDSLQAERILSAIRMAMDDPAEFAARPDSVVTSDVRHIFWFGVLGNSRYPFPAWTDLQGSGGLDLLPNDLRRGLSELDQALERYYFSTGDLQAFIVERMDGYTLHHFDGRNLHAPADPEIRPGTRPSLDFLNDRETMAAAMAKLSLVNGVKRTLDAALVELRETRVLIPERIPS